ncbi:MAG: hypothetical protein HY537_12415 [Deltaproteobacteria bacterium]|nr:hypothetical protein [Deltaproteobacteria bacterium]
MGWLRTIGLVFFLLSPVASGWSAPLSTPTELQTFDPDFFTPREGKLELSEGGQFGCTTVAVDNEKVASSKLGRIGEKYCNGPVNIQYVRKKVGFTWEGYRDEGYYQICCVRKGSSKAPRRSFVNQ